MNIAEEMLQQSIVRVIVVQGLTTLLVAIIALSHGWFYAISAAYGGALTIIVAILSGQWVFREKKMTQADPLQSATALYAVAIKRMLVTVAGFAVALGIYKMPPTPLFLGFGAACVGYIFASPRGRY